MVTQLLLHQHGEKTREGETDQSRRPRKGTVLTENSDFYLSILYFTVLTGKFVLQPDKTHKCEHKI